LGRSRGRAPSTPFGVFADRAEPRRRLLRAQGRAPSAGCWTSVSGRKRLITTARPRTMRACMGLPIRLVRGRPPSWLTGDRGMARDAKALGVRNAVAGAGRRPAGNFHGHFRTAGGKPPGACGGAGPAHGATPRGSRVGGKPVQTVQRAGGRKSDRIVAGESGRSLASPSQPRTHSGDRPNQPPTV